MVVTLLQSDTSDLRELCRIAGGDPATFYRGMDLTNLDLSEADRELFQQGEVSDAIIRIKRAVRQEERIAILLDQILQNRSVGISALLQYSNEKAKFARNAAVLIRNRFNSNDKDASNDQLIAASLMQKLFTDVFPYNRGHLLYYLAKHLAKYPSVNAAIRQCMSRSASMFVDRVRPDIERLLSPQVLKSRLEDSIIPLAPPHFDSQSLRSAIAQMISYAHATNPNWILGVHPGGRLLSVLVAEELRLPRDRCLFGGFSSTSRLLKNPSP